MSSASTDTTEITVTFSGYRSYVVSDDSSGWGCDEDGDGTYELDLPAQHYIDYNIEYEISGVSSVPNSLTLDIVYQRYHLGNEQTSTTSYTPSSLSGYITATNSNCTTTISNQICVQVEQSCTPIGLSASCSNPLYTVKVVDNVTDVKS